MQFDSILDKQFVDFEHKDNQLKLFNMLDRSKLPKEAVNITTGEIRKIIDDAYERKNFEPCLEWFKVNTIELNTQYTDIKQEYSTMVGFEEDGDLLALYTCALDIGIHDLYALTILLMIKRYQTQFNFNDFLFCVVRFETEEKNIEQTANSLFGELQKSRINYILKKTYLPVVCVIHGQRHATSILILPFLEENKSVTFINIHINSNGDKVTYKYRETIFDVAIENYKKWISRQNEHKINERKIFCFSNIQKQYSTCGHWSLFIAFRFLQDFTENKIININSVMSFCELMFLKNNNSEIHEKFNEFIIDIKIMYKCLIVNTVNSINDIRGSYVFEFPGVDEFCKVLLHGRTPEHLILNVEIMKSLSNLNQLRDDDSGEGKNDDSRDDDAKDNHHIYSLTPVQQLRKYKKQKFTQFSLHMKDFNNVMQRLDESSQKPLNVLTFEEGINFAKDFASLVVTFVNKAEFHVWLEYWYIEQNKEKRDLMRRRNRAKTASSMYEPEPLGRNDTVIDSQIKKFLKFTNDLLRQQLMSQFSEWTIPQSFYSRP